MKQVIWTNFANNELKNIFNYHKLSASEKTARKILAKIYKSTNFLIKYHEMGAIEPNLEELKQHHRFILQGNYKIMYRIIKEDIYVVDIFDCQQDPDKLGRSVK